MAAARHIHPDQLRMFIPASELSRYNPNPSDVSYAGFNNPVEYREKRLKPAAQERGITESVKEEGVRRPVSVFHGDPMAAITSWHDPSIPTIAQGNHRVAAAEADDLLVPVRHFAGPHHRFSQAVQMGKD